MQESKRRRYLANRAAKREKRRAKRKHATYKPWHHLTRSQQEVAKRLVARGFFAKSAKSKGHFALDATDLETTPKCVGAGRKTYREWKVVRQKGKGRKAVEVERSVYGFKVLIVYEVRLRLVVAAKVVPIQQHESGYTLALVRQAVKNLGAGVLRVLLIDRGFLDGRDLWVLKHELGLDFVVPAKENMRITARTELGQELANRGVRRQRAEEQVGKVVIFAGDYYGIFDIEEVFILLGVVSRLCLRTDPAQVRRRYGLPSLA